MTGACVVSTWKMAQRIRSIADTETWETRVLGSPKRLDDPCVFGSNTPLPPDCIQILVGVRWARQWPSRRLQTLLITAEETGMLLEAEDIPNLDAWTNGECISTDTLRSSLPWMWTLPPKKLYVRQEIVMVWHVFKQHFHNRFFPDGRDDLDSADHKQQLVLVGSPGVGTTSLLLLMCLYVEVKLRHRVVLFRKLDRHDATVYLLLGDACKYYAWERLPLSDYGGTRVTAYNKFREVAVLAASYAPTKSRVWLCADKLFHEEARVRLPSIKLDLHVAPDALPEASSGSNVAQCLVPLWSEADVVAASRKMKMWRDAIDRRYRNAGGNLHWFDKGDAYAADAVYTTVDRISSAVERGRPAVSGHEAIAMLAVADVNNIEEYTSPALWRREVSSPLAKSLLPPGFS